MLSLLAGAELFARLNGSALDRAFRRLSLTMSGAARLRRLDRLVRLQ